MVLLRCEKPAEPEMLRTVASVAASSEPPLGTSWPAARGKVQDSRSVVPLSGALFGRRTKRANSPTFIFTALHRLALMTSVIKRSPCHTVWAAIAGEAKQASKTVQTSVRFIVPPFFLVWKLQFRIRRQVPSKEKSAHRASAF